MSWDPPGAQGVSAASMSCWSQSRLTNLRTARIAEMGLTMRITQWLVKPAAEFIYAAGW